MTRQEAATEAFYNWETGLRGWVLYDEPVEIEPPYQGYISPPTTEYDSGRFRLFRPTKRESERIQPQAQRVYPWVELAALEVTLPQNEFGSGYDIERCLFLLSKDPGDVSFEIHATHDVVKLCWICEQRSVSNVLNLLSSYFPEIRVVESDLPIIHGREETTGVVDFGLDHEVMFPLEVKGRSDTELHRALYSTMLNLNPGERIVYQTTFSATTNPWSYAMKAALTLTDGSNFFPDSPELYASLSEKLGGHLVSTRMRVLIDSGNRATTQRLAQRVFQAFESFRSPGQNGLIPLSNTGLSFNEHLASFNRRVSCRPGFLLSVQELSTLVHYPSDSIQSEKLRGQSRATHPVPSDFMDKTYVLGTNSHVGSTVEVSVTNENRLRHTHVIGATGVGKSSLILSMALEDARHGNGFSVFDPHGDLVDDILSRLPVERLKDVILFDPSDSEFPIGFNLLEAHSEAEKVILNSDLVSVFRRAATSWGDQMTNILSMAISAFLEREEPGSLLELRHFLQDNDFRNSVLKDVTDPVVKYYWINDFPQLRKGSISPILTRLNSFLGPKVIRNMMAIRRGLDFGQVLSGRRIFLAKLSHGQIGEENSHLLGTLLLSKHYQAALSRQNSSGERHPHFLYIDEFHNFLSSSLPGILTGVRKYGLGLILAHQNLAQLRGDDGLREVLLANAYIRVAFRLGDDDSYVFDKGTDHFIASDYSNLSIGEAICRIGRAKDDFSLDTKHPDSHGQTKAEQITSVLNQTRQHFATPLSEVNETVSRLYQLANMPDRGEPKDSPEEEVTVLQEPEHVQAFEERKAQVIEEHSKKKALRLHTYLQKSVASMAQSFGWKSEEEITVGNRRIDVLLTRGDTVVGIEISVTNSVDYELESIQECIWEHELDMILLVTDENKRDSALKSIEGWDQVLRKKLEVWLEEDLRQWFQDTVEVKNVQQKVAGRRIRVQCDSANEGSGEQDLRARVIAALRKKK